MYKLLIFLLLLIPTSIYGLTHDDKLQPTDHRFEVSDISVNIAKPINGCCIIMGLIKNTDNVTYANITIGVTIFAAKTGSIKDFEL